MQHLFNFLLSASFFLLPLEKELHFRQQKNRPNREQQKQYIQKHAKNVKVIPIKSAINA
jgi:hypothetical protein